MLICLSNHLLVRVLPHSLSPHVFSSNDDQIRNQSGLNYRLQQMGTKTTVVAFIIMPAATNSYTIEALKGQAVTKQLRDTVTEIQNRIGARLFERTARYTGLVSLFLSFST